MRQQEAATYRGYRTAGVRLKEELVPNLAVSESTDATLYAIHRFDKAHVVMLVEEAIIARDDGVAILEVLRRMDNGDAVGERLAAGGGEHSGEQILIRQLGERVGGQIHLGRSSGDLVAVSRRIFWRDRLLDVIDGINSLRQVLIETAERHMEIVMPGYTHGLSAQPTTYAHQLLAWELALARDVERARGAYERVNLSPAGAAILTGSSFPLNRQRTAELLGFTRPLLNTFDAILQHDDELEMTSVLAIHCHNMARFADDIMFWSASEVGMISIPDRFCGTSSIMMQKKNPYATEHIKGAAGAAVGAVVAAFTVEKGPTGTPIVDREYAEIALERQFNYVLRDLDWMCEMVPEIVANAEVMYEGAGAFWAQATDVAAALVKERGYNWRTAHQIVGILVRYTEERELRPRDVTTELLDEAAVEYMDEPVRLSDAALAEALDPTKFVLARTLYGGPAPEAVRERLPDYRAGLDEDRQWRDGVRLQQRVSESKLDAAVDELIG